MEMETLKSYSEVVKKDPYLGIVIQMLQCVGHIQKRVSNVYKN